ncbi:MAG: T9SS type A sorting domain-containing protein [Chitinophagaceae bacterium]|nr:T9SS type A sorting domain-containing protein [Chitinophagaceae bacterium]
MLTKSYKPLMVRMRNCVFLLCFMICCVGDEIFAQPNIQWQKSLGGTAQDHVQSIHQTTDGGYICAGCSESNDGNVSGNHGGGGDFWVVKLNSSGNIEWQKALGSSGFDFAQDVVQTSDGGYIVAGLSDMANGDVTVNHGNSDYWVVKLSATGSIQWQKSYGGTSIDVACSIKQTMEGGYIVAGYSFSNDVDATWNWGGKDYWIVKLGATGNLEWQKSYGGVLDEQPAYIEQTIDSGYVVGGISNSTNSGNVSNGYGLNDVWLIKMDKNGVLQWQKAMGGYQPDGCEMIKQTPDKGYIVVGASVSTSGDLSFTYGLSDYWVVKLDSLGNKQWGNRYGGSYNEGASAVELTPDGGYLVAGPTESYDNHVSFNHGYRDYWLIKLNSSGGLEWQKTYGGYYDDWVVTMDKTSDGGCILAGYSDSNDGDVTGNHGLRDFWIVKLNSFLGTTEEVWGQNLTVYPNPVEDILCIQSDKTLKNAHLVIHDIFGKEIYTGIFSGMKVQLPIKVAPGMYTLQIRQDGQVSVKKFLVAH